MKISYLVIMAGMLILFLPFFMINLNFDYSILGNASREKIIDAKSISPKDYIETSFSSTTREYHALTYNPKPVTQPIKSEITYPNGEVKTHDYRTKNDDIGGWYTPFDPKSENKEFFKLKVTNMGNQTITLDVIISSESDPQTRSNIEFASFFAGIVVLLLGIAFFFGGIKKKKSSFDDTKIKT